MSLPGETGGQAENRSTGRTRRPLLVRMTGAAGERGDERSWTGGSAKRTRREGAGELGAGAGAAGGGCRSAVVVSPGLASEYAGFRRSMETVMLLVPTMMRNDFSARERTRWGPV
jgi:hypothetical protein